jgi:hypothetical protein
MGIRGKAITGQMAYRRMSAVVRIDSAAEPPFSLGPAILARGLFQDRVSGLARVSRVPDLFQLRVRDLWIGILAADHRRGPGRQELARDRNAHGDSVCRGRGGHGAGLVGAERERRRSPRHVVQTGTET